MPPAAKAGKRVVRAEDGCAAHVAPWWIPAPWVARGHHDKWFLRRFSFLAGRRAGSTVCRARRSPVAADCARSCAGSCLTSESVRRRRPTQRPTEKQSCISAICNSMISASPQARANDRQSPSRLSFSRQDQFSLLSCSWFASSHVSRQECCEKSALSICRGKSPSVY